MSRLTGLQMEAVLNRSIEVLRRLDDLWDLKHPPHPHPPASAEALAKLGALVPWKFPPSYIQLLRIHDGIDNFYGINGELLSSAQRLTPHDFESEWRRSQLLFFIMDDDWNAVAFDTTTRNSDGEMEVLEIAENVDSDRWPSLADFLVGYKHRLEGWLAGEEADRSKVDDA